MVEPFLRELQMKHCLLIADDLTGACDAAVQFAIRGWRAMVSLSADGGGDADVLAVSTETREAGAGEFRPRLPFFPARIFFKKIDSLLRGHPAEEIRVIAELLECDAAVITPAFPVMARIVQNGVLR